MEKVSGYNNGSSEGGGGGGGSWRLDGRYPSSAIIPPEINFDGVEGREISMGLGSASLREGREMKSGHISRFFQTLTHFDLDAESAGERARGLLRP